MYYCLKALWNRIFRRKEIKTIVKEAGYKDGHFTLVLEHPGFQIWAQEVGQMLRAYNAPNFLETTLFDTATMRQYTITVQDKTRPTPAEVIKILRGALEDIALDQEHIHPKDFSWFARRAATIALEEVGYLQQEAQA